MMHPPNGLYGSLYVYIYTTHTYIKIYIHYTYIFLSRSVSSALVLEANHRIFAFDRRVVRVRAHCDVGLATQRFALRVSWFWAASGVGGLERNRETFGLMISAFFEHQSDRCVAFLGAYISRLLFWVLGKFPVMAALRCLVEEDVEG